MRALTLWEPWASLIAWDEKRYETRHWSTQYRGPLAIHAGIIEDGWEVVFVNRFYRDALARHAARFDELPFGKMLCVVDLTDVVPTEALRGVVSQQEHEFGDFSSGRFAWKLEHLRVLAEPMPTRGRQGLWDWPVDVESLSFKEIDAKVSLA